MGTTTEPQPKTELHNRTQAKEAGTIYPGANPSVFGVGSSVPILSAMSDWGLIQL